MPGNSRMNKPTLLNILVFRGVGFLSLNCLILGGTEILKTVRFASY